MITEQTHRRPFNPSYWFYAGLGTVMMALWLFFIPEWLTFMHSWRIELFASVFLLATLSYLFYRSGNLQFRIGFSDEERRFILFPIVAFILWSAASISWAPSWKSALHHTLVWSEYLIFFCIVRYLLERESNYQKLAKLFALTLMIYALPAVAAYGSFLVFGGTITLGVQFARFGEQVLTISPLLIAGVVRFSGRRFLAGLAAVALLWLLIFSSLGRANIVLYAGTTLTLATLIFTFRRYRKYRLKMALVVVALVLSTASIHLLTLFSVAPEVPMVTRMQDKEGISGSNDFRKLMIGISAEMIAANPIIGLGADNFGFQTNHYRAIYASGNPNAPGLDQAENTIPERAHNEYLQIAAELGSVGIAIFLWFLAGIALIGYRALKGLGRHPLHAPAAVFGLSAFLVSAFVTSYSFRLIQNGFAFFFVLAVASKLLLKSKSPEKCENSPALSTAMFRFACAAGIIACLLSTLYWAIRVSSAAATDRASQVQEFDKAANLFSLAMRLDDENPKARNNFGMRLFWEERYSEAIPYLREAIKIGSASSTSFSYLASAHILAGDNFGAEATMKQAAGLYPRSVFVLTRYAVLLKENGKPHESEAVFARALSIDRPAANTWLAVITSGPNKASALAVNLEDYNQVMELQPQTAIYAAVAERLIRYPEERRFSLLKLPSFNKTDVPEE